MLASVHDYQAAAQLGEQSYPLAIGTPSERRVVMAWADNLTRVGQGAEAAKLLADFVTFFPQDQALLQNALSDALVGADSNVLRPLLPIMLKQDTALSESGILALYVLCRNAVKANDVKEAKHWLEVMNQYAAEHRLTGMARHLMKTMKTPDPVP